MPIPKINKFSRSKIVDEPIEEDIKPIEKPKPKRSRKEPPQPIQEIYEEDSPIDIDDEHIDFNEPIEDNNFLSELNNINFKEEVKEEIKEPKKESNLLNIIENHKRKKQPKQPKQIKNDYDDDSLFGDIPTEIIGRDKRELLTKIQQYKNLFPTELKKFKIKKNPNVDDLQIALNEMESIVDCSSLENFLTDSILQCIKLVEGVSSYTSKYNIEGCADMLKSNPQFNALCKRLYIKYKVFSEIPPEWQMLMIVSTTAYICKTKNNKRLQYENYLNEPINTENNN